ncbi:aldo/keto reductase [Flavisphingomonas formosensis]|uniref:aldo/keto reductase n=1 Tax=Flavisphingomonas formosensis TaxID=861534 RepID=UPI0012F7CDAC|nr:aldo/keto reductase [Sphingomonas formosensis]
MRYRLHGRSGLRVSELCLGTMTFGEGASWSADAAESRAMFDVFAEAGGTFIDTAHMYMNGESERLVGDFIRADREHFVVATKYTPDAGPDISKSGNSRKVMRRCVEESLTRLGTDHIDLYLLHYWDGTTPIEEIMRGLDDLVSAGKVTYIAVSDVAAWQISRANMLADLRGWAPFIGMQIEYSLLQRTAERELIPMAEELDMGVTAWSPLAGGILSGKYLGSSETGPARRTRADIPQHSLEVAELVADIGRQIGRSPSQVALAALMQLRPEAGVIPIIGGRTAAQLKDNLGCIEFRLDADQLKAIDGKTPVEMGFPYTTIDHPFMIDLAFGTGNRQKLDNHRARRLGRQ